MLQQEDILTEIDENDLFEIIMGTNKKIIVNKRVFKSLEDGAGKGNVDARRIKQVSYLRGCYLIGE